ncbi:DNA methyltransferase [Opitutaceae bacterium EW11]|nr:DNA methyltransferase [Opitutaceae bacterium EW11]
MSHPVADYLSQLYSCLGVGVPETSGYPALSALLNTVGESLSPKITAVIHPANTGAGLPDGGLFSAKDLKKNGPNAQTLFELKPERGVIEVKGLAEDITGIEKEPQVSRYLQHYGQVLVTNYRSYAMFSWEGGAAKRGETFTIAESEQAFWEKVQDVRRVPNHPVLERLFQYLKRALLSTARITTPEDLAAFLASYASEARARVELAPLKTLSPVQKALSDALGIHFDGEKGTHFFQATLVQTLFYGLFSAWVLWHESAPGTGDRFKWKLSADYLGLPILRTLFVQLAGDSRKLQAMDLEEVLNWTEDCLARVDRTSFFARYDMGDAVQYFYEPFLAKFDPDLRKQFGVWYTPPEVVRYMVGRVDEVLRDHFGLADGLADPSVIVLDPCCGTGAYLVETLRMIYGRFDSAYGKTQAAVKIRELAKNRLFGFELLPAPYVVSHLQIDLMLTRWGAALDHHKDERAGVFLTNSLTGWVPVKSPKDQVLFPEFSDERDAAERVKRKEQILVIIGNPPYDGFAGLAVEEERNLSEAYRQTKEVAPPQGQGLNDPYIRFFRMAERRITEGVPDSDSITAGVPVQDAKGVVCFISNYSWLAGLSHTGMRERYMEVFDEISIDCLNGDKFATGKKTPDGSPDPSVFSTEKNPEGIQVGTAIALLERHGLGALAKKKFDPEKYTPRAQVHFRNWWGKQKRSELLSSLQKPVAAKKLAPAQKFNLVFTPVGVRVDYESWPLLTEVFPQGFSGIKTARDRDLVSIDEKPLQERMAKYFDPSVSLDTLKKFVPELTSSDDRYDPAAVRKTLLARGETPKSITKYCYRPFDVRFLYWELETKLLDERRSELRPQIFRGNVGFVLAQKTRKGFQPPIVTPLPASYHVVENVSLWFPLYVDYSSTSHDSHTTMDFFSKSGPQPNISEAAAGYLDHIGAAPDDLFYHAIAIMHSAEFCAENADALELGWPRIPLPSKKNLLRKGAELGRSVSALLDTEADVTGVTGLRVLPFLKGLAELSVGSSGKKGAAPNLEISAGWGYIQQAKHGAIVMPGGGKVEHSREQPGMLDVYLNETTYWKNVPEQVWEYTLGGYQVLKKWLSYREVKLLGRAITSDEAQSFTVFVRRIAALLSMQADLDGHYSASADDSVQLKRK